MHINFMKNTEKLHNEQLLLHIRCANNSDDQVVSETYNKTKNKIKYIYDENGNLVKKTL